MFAVIFEVCPAAGRHDEYLGYGRALRPILEAIDGFIDNERFESRSQPGWILSLSTWRDEKSVIRWRTEAKHYLIQETGRQAVFADYHLRVGEVTDDTHPPLPLRQERFDTTETGRSRVCTIIDVTPEAADMLPGDADALIAAAGLDRTAQGLNELETYASLYNPGKLLILNSWALSAPAEVVRPAGIRGAAAVRRRAVRIIRDYGMFDRREATQYHRDVQPRA